MTWLATLAESPGNPALSQFIVSTASALTVALLVWLIRVLRKFGGEHEWLMEQTKKNSEATKANTEAIRKILERRQTR